MFKATFQEDMDAQRVFVVGQDIKIDSNKLAQAVKEGLSQLTLGQGQSTSYIPLEIEKNVFIPQVEIKFVEVPTFIKEIEYREIEKPIYIEKLVTVEKPVVIKEIEIKEIYIEKFVPRWQKVCIYLQTLAVFGLILSHFIK